MLKNFWAKQTVEKAKQDQLTTAEIISTAFQNCLDKGIDPQLIASTALTASLSQLVKTTDKQTAIRITKRLIGAIEDGKFGE